MAYDLEEQEKLDAIKAWWARYGTLVMLLVAAVALAWGGWWGAKAYQSHKANQAMGYFRGARRRGPPGRRRFVGAHQGRRGDPARAIRLDRLRHPRRGCAAQALQALVQHALMAAIGGQQGQQFTGSGSGIPLPQLLHHEAVQLPAHGGFVEEIQRLQRPAAGHVGQHARACRVGQPAAEAAGRIEHLQLGQQQHQDADHEYRYQ